VVLATAVAVALPLMRVPDAHSREETDMSIYGQPAYQETQRVAPLATPMTLKLATACAAVTALAALASAAMALIFGRDMLRALVQRELGSLGGGGLLADAIETAFATLQARAYIWIFLGVAIGLLAVPIRTGRTWARVTLIPFAFGATLLGLLAAVDPVSPILVGLAALTVVSAFLTFLACWLPASNRYARQRRRQAAAGG
jgi:hypothetical protein